MNRDNLGTCLAAAFVALALTGWAGVAWYLANVQAEVWQREGVQITTWEVFCGAKPVERSVTLKPAKE